MSTFQTAIEPLIIGLLKNEAIKAPSVKINLVLLLPAMFFTVLGLIFTGLAAYGWLTTHYPRDTANLLMGIGLFITAVLCAGIASGINAYMNRMAKNYYRSVYRTVADNIHSLIDVIGKELEEPLHEYPKTAAALATVAGFMTGEAVHDFKNEMMASHH